MRLLRRLGGAAASFGVGGGGDGLGARVGGASRLAAPGLAPRPRWRPTRAPYAIGRARRGEAHAVVALDAVADRALGGDDAHDEAIGEEGDLVDGVVVGGIGHRQHQAVAVELERQDAKLGGHVGGDQRQHLLGDVDQPMIGRRAGS